MKPACFLLAFLKPLAYSGLSGQFCFVCQLIVLAPGLKVPATILRFPWFSCLSPRDCQGIEKVSKPLLLYGLHPEWKELVEDQGKSAGGFASCITVNKSLNLCVLASSFLKLD